MSGHDDYDLWFDPNQVGGDLVVECWISHGPRADDRGSILSQGDTVLVGDDDEAPLRPGSFVVKAIGSGSRLR